VEWHEVPSFKNQRPGPEVRAKLKAPRDADHEMPTQVRGMKVIICFMRSPIFGRNPPYELMRTTD
jgi:hypothetical protein